MQGTKHKLSQQTPYTLMIETSQQPFMGWCHLLAYLYIHGEGVEPHWADECYPCGQGVHHLKVGVDPDSCRKFTRKVLHPIIEA